MTLKELSVITGCKIDVSYSQHIFRFIAHSKNIEIKVSKNSRIFGGVYGYGRTKKIALENYAKQINGHYLVVNPCGINTRFEFQLPKTLRA